MLKRICKKKYVIHVRAKTSTKQWTIQKNYLIFIKIYHFYLETMETMDYPKELFNLHKDLPFLPESK